MESIELQVINNLGNQVGKKEVASFVFDETVSHSLLHQVVRWQRACWRAGTHKVKTRAEVSGGGAKPWKQKGNGRARAGSNTSPVWVGGGVAHGPKPHKYDFKINKRDRKKALAGAIAARKSEGRLVVLDSFGLSEIKTKKALEVLKSVGLGSARSILVVIPAYDDVVFRSLRNAKGVKVIDSKAINVYDIIAHEYLLVLADAFNGIESKISF
ncbi:MAG: 50S ribosomal protein L4 [Deltaproteobacteria bacterium]|jgi:large subunit ribosomal protein L4|nr:50S ribosomal protein L4 [Deltaproteobacteria bacterium]